MKVHWWSFAVASVLGLSSVGCAGRISHIELVGDGDVCQATKPETIKISRDESNQKFQGIAWVVTNLCSMKRQLIIGEFTRDGKKVDPPLDQACTLKVDVAPGRIKTISCFVLGKTEVPKGKYQYQIKLESSTVIDPDLIIKR